MASGREWLRRTCVRLCVQELPACAEGPFTLATVTAAPRQPAWEPVPQPVPGMIKLHVTIPLICQLRDRNGMVFAAENQLETDVCMHLSCGPAEYWRNAMMVLPCVRLCSLPCPSSDGCFDAQLEVLVDAYMTRWEPCTSQTPRGTSCACRDVPLYPQPRCDG